VLARYHPVMNQHATGSGATVPPEAPPSPRLSVALLQAENRRLKQQLESLLAEARLNQDKLRRFDQLERRLIAAATPGALIDILLGDYPALFQLDAVTLALVDTSHEVRALLGEHAGAEGLLLLSDDATLQARYGETPRPVLAAARPEHDVLFEGSPVAPASVALLPLVQHGQLIGSLNLGSRDAQRFVAGSSTDFLVRLAALAALCLHNALATERLKLAGLTDALTGVHNRRYFEARCLEEVQAARRNKLPLVCMFLDVDRFKNLNDTLGHPAGDQVLRYVARLIKVQLRGSDVVARYGGEEFVVLLPATPLQSGLETAERIRRVVAAQSVPVAGQGDVHVTISIGVSLLHLPEQDADAEQLVAQMIERADQAVYAAKQAGRNQVVCRASA
jgi:diguanylate cyclase (GGDEF)-like protein